MSCIFCKIIKGDIPSEKIYEDEKYLAFLDIKPVKAGHTLVIPKKHYDNLLAAPDAELEGLLDVAKKVGVAVMAATGSDGMNFTSNIGVSAGQVIFHTHFHLIPRKTGDRLVSWPHREYANGEFAKIGQAVREKLL